MEIINEKSTVNEINKSGKNGPRMVNKGIKKNKITNKLAIFSFSFPKIDCDKIIIKNIVSKY